MWLWALWENFTINLSNWFSVIIIVVFDRINYDRGVLYSEEAADSGGLDRLCESTKLCVEDLHRVCVCMTITG